MAKKKAAEERTTDYKETAPKMQDAASDIIEELEAETTVLTVSDGAVDVDATPPLPPVPDPTPKQIPIYEMQLTEEEQELILKSRMQSIIARNKIPYIPTLIKTKTYESSMPVKVLIQLDHIIVRDAWEFYSFNTKEPTGRGFIEMLNSIIGERGKIIHRVVEMNLL